MPYTPCHECWPEGPALTAQMPYTCGRCGGDRRRPINSLPDATATADAIIETTSAARQLAAALTRLDAATTLTDAEQPFDEAVALVEANPRLMPILAAWVDRETQRVVDDMNAYEAGR